MRKNSYDIYLFFEGFYIMNEKFDFFNKNDSFKNIFVHLHVL